MRALLLVAAALLAPAASPAAAAPPLTFGITPAGEAGALGPTVPPVPDNPPRTLAALQRLRPRGAPFVLRLNRFFWSDGQAGIDRFAALARRYTRAGFRVELQLRYHPRPEQVGDTRAWLAFVREVVDTFGPNRRVVGLQVTNEVNFTISPDSSDGAYAGARDALIAGVEAAHAQATRRGYRQLRIGFNWFFRTDAASEDAFWGYLRDHGGRAFVHAVNWVGLDAYPGTVFPPAVAPGGYGPAMVAALRSLRRHLRGIGIGRATPIHVEENGWPTLPPARTAAEQAQALRAMVRAADAERGPLHVTDYRWFDLRDHRTASTNFQHHYGLLRDDYSPKPAYGAYRRLVAALSRRP